MSVTDPNDMNVGVKSRLNSRIICFHAVRCIMVTIPCLKILGRNLQNYNFFCCIVWAWNRSLALSWRECFKDKVLEILFGCDITRKWQ